MRRSEVKLLSVLHMLSLLYYLCCSAWCYALPLSSSPLHSAAFTRQDNRSNEQMAEPGATAQRPQLSRPVRAHVPRQLGSWLICNVRQKILTTMNASMIDGLLSLAAGVYCSLVGFGVVSPSKDKIKGEAWRKKWGGFMKIAGPLIAVWGAYNIVRSL